MLEPLSPQPPGRTALAATPSSRCPHHERDRVALSGPCRDFASVLRAVRSARAAGSRRLDGA
jgi:hypothetical protein